MRGCTDDHLPLPQGEDLFPAHAGMHRSPHRSASPCPPVPRACGDAPDKGRLASELLDCSPRMRGCTDLQPARQRRDRLFPAHAGMHRACTRTRRRNSAVPRACGDAPYMDVTWQGKVHCSPRMRGCTAYLAEVRAERQLFPAHAGMHRRAACCCRTATPVPRACGDAPLTRTTPQRRRSCSPRMRGCTDRRRGEPASVPLFPAHAGMHRPRGSPTAH